MKDNFSHQSDKYAQYRPSYPPGLFEYINQVAPAKQHAWDCGTGNGQVACELAKTFRRVSATDISPAQIAQAPKADNIHYSVQPAEHTDFEDRQFDLITVAQAIHWFDFDQFYSEARRTAKEEALILVIGYARITITPSIDHVITNFYEREIGPYWDKERRHIDEKYETIPFPFDEIQTPKFVNKQQWSMAHLMGYLNTWSAVRHFVNLNGYNPVEGLQSKLEQAWGSVPTREVEFPLLLRAGKIST